MIPRIEIVCWIAESKRPFAIVKDHGFRELMKTGRPEYRLPLPATVSQDVKHVFVSMRSLVASKLKVSLPIHKLLIPIQRCEGTRWLPELCYHTWTSPNGQAYIAVTVHLEIHGVAESMLLDIVEYASSHTGENLASTFAKVLKDFGISDKVCLNEKEIRT